MTSCSGIVDDTNDNTNNEQRNPPAGTPGDKDDWKDGTSVQGEGSDHATEVSTVTGSLVAADKLTAAEAPELESSQMIVRAKDNNDTAPPAWMEASPAQELREKLQVGDHVYQWRSFLGIPGVFQHHGIVLEIFENENEEDVEERTKMLIADFSNVSPALAATAALTTNKTGNHDHNNQSRSPFKRKGLLTQQGILRTYVETGKHSWHKVHYKASWWQRHLFRAGTCTSAASDATGLVLARVHFIVQHPECIPDYHVLFANCECVAVWCKTGRWSTLQGSSLLEMTTAGQVKSSTVLATVAANTSVTVPANGIWGWMGYTTQASLVSLHPGLVPALASYAVVTVGIPVVVYSQAQAKWKETSRQLTEAFWKDAMEEPALFSECLTHWSDK